MACSVYMSMEYYLCIVCPMVVHAMQSLQYLALLQKASQLCIMIAITT